MKDLVVGQDISFEDRHTELEAKKEREEKKKIKERKSTSNRCAQFNLEHTKDLMWLSLNHPKAHAILYFLVDQMDAHNAVMCNYSVLQNVLKISKPTVTRSIKVLKENGYITVLKIGSSNVYVINDKIYRKSWVNNREYSKSPASILLALCAQSKGKVK